MLHLNNVYHDRAISKRFHLNIEVYVCGETAGGAACGGTEAGDSGRDGGRNAGETGILRRAASVDYSTDALGPSS